MSFGQAIKSVFSKYVTFSGRARRKEYWYFILFNLIVSIVLGILSAVTGAEHFFRVIGWVVSLALLLPGIAVAVRRLHDTGRSGWWYLLDVAALVLVIIAETISYSVLRSAVLANPETLDVDAIASQMSNSAGPLAIGGLLILAALGLAIWFLVLMCKDSQPGENKYGPNPKAVETGVSADQIFQTAMAHAPTYIYADSAATTLDPMVSSAMARVFPEYDGVSHLESLLPGTDLEALRNGITLADTDTLLVLFKYTAVAVNRAADPSGIIAMQNMLVAALKARMAW